MPSPVNSKSSSRRGSATSSKSSRDGSVKSATARTKTNEKLSGSRPGSKTSVDRAKPSEKKDSRPPTGKLSLDLQIKGKSTSGSQPSSRPTSASSRGSRPRSRPSSAGSKTSTSKKPATLDRRGSDGRKSNISLNAIQSEHVEESELSTNIRDELAQTPQEELVNAMDMDIMNEVDLNDNIDNNIDTGDLNLPNIANDNEDEENALIPGSAISSDDEDELIVLDPDHPLMSRFQVALSNHLNKLNERLTLEFREISESYKKKKVERDDVGVELYGVQQELARLQAQVEACHDEFSSLTQKRQKCDVDLADTRNLFMSRQQQLFEENRKETDLRTQVENLHLKMFYLSNAKDDVKSDISVMRRVAQKADTETAKLEFEKKKQDLYVNRLVERVDALREDISMLETQIVAQHREAKEAKDALHDAQAEIETIDVEKRQLFQQWNSSLIGMGRRDEARAAMQDALNQQQQELLSLATEIDAYKKTVISEQQENEKLTSIANKWDSDILTSKKSLENCQNLLNALKREYHTCAMILQQTEQNLTKVNTDKTIMSSKLDSMRKEIESMFKKKVALEDEIVEILRSKLTADKAAQYSNRLIQGIRDRTRELESEIAIVENDITQYQFATSEVNANKESLEKKLDNLDKEIRAKNENKYCKAWADMEYCHSKSKHYRYMKLNCRSACSFCDEGKSKCKDSNRHCHYWSNSGYCEDEAYRRYMLKYCASSCGKCSENQSEHESAEDKVGGSATTGKPLDTIFDKGDSNPSSSCEDENKHCHYWEGKGYCSPGEEYYPYMKKFCKKSCDMCDGREKSLMKQKEKKMKDMKDKKVAKYH